MLTGTHVPRPNETDFEALVEQALSDLPADIAQRMDNVAVTIADWPTASELRRAQVQHPHQLFGLYEGIPLTRRGSRYSLVPPDRIIIYRGPLLSAYHSPSVLREQIRRTVVHEIAHHFGMSEARLRELGY